MSIFRATFLVSKADGIDASLHLTVYKTEENSESKSLENGLPAPISERVPKPLKKNYIFNLPESLQRLGNTHGINLTGVSAVFVPAPSYRSMVVNFVRCISDQRLSKIKLLGPLGSDKLRAAYTGLNSNLYSRTFVDELTPNQTGSCYEDSCVSVCALCAGASTAEPPWWLTATDVGVMDLLTDSDDETTYDEGPSKRKFEDVIDLVSDDGSWYGGSNFKRCACESSEITSQPIAWHLAESSASSSGESRILCFVVLLKQTRELLLVVVLPDESSLHELKKHPLWTMVGAAVKSIKAVLHLSDPGFMGSGQYRRWATALPGEQIYCDGTLGEGMGLDVGLFKVLLPSLRLRAVAPKHYPLPASYYGPCKPCGSVCSEMPLDGSSIVTLLSEVSYDSEGSHLQIKPHPLQAINPEAVAEALKQNVLLRVLNEMNESCHYSSDDPWSYYLPIYPQGLQPVGPIPPPILAMAMEKDPSSVLFLGTGCAVASAWRGGSAILIRMGIQQRGLLLDCAEGTYGQLVRYLGAGGAREAVDTRTAAIDGLRLLSVQVNALECVWISHIHGDHCAGLPALLSERDRRLPPVTIFCPEQVAKTVELGSLPGRCFNNMSLNNSFRPRQALGIVSWKAFPVLHSIEAYGMKITWSNGFSLVYSGDTQPCAELTAAATRATLLIHESTHAACDEDFAKCSLHSTWKQALATAHRAGTYRTILTHFSRRYKGLPEGLSAEALGKKAAVAFDGMLVKFTDLPFLPHLNEAVEEALLGIESGDLAFPANEERIDLPSEVPDDDDTYMELDRSP